MRRRLGAVLNGTRPWTRRDQNQNQHRGEEVALSDHPPHRAQALHHRMTETILHGPLSIKVQGKTWMMIQKVKKVMVRSLQARGRTKTNLQLGTKIQTTPIVMTEPSVKSSRKLEMGLSIQKRGEKDLKEALLTSMKKMAGKWPLAKIVTLRPLKRYIG